MTSGRLGDDRLVRGEAHDVAHVDVQAGKGSDESGVTEGEHAAVVAHHPVAAAVRGGHHTDDVVDNDVQTRDRPHEAGVTEGEHAAVRADHPVAATVVGGHGSHDVG